MFKIGTALVTGVLAAFFTVVSAFSSGARFFTAAGRSVAVFLVVTAIVFLIAFLLEKQFLAFFAGASEADQPPEKEGKAPRTANDNDEIDAIADAEEDGEAAQARDQEPDTGMEVLDAPAAAASRGE